MEVCPFPCLLSTESRTPLQLSQQPGRGFYQFGLAPEDEVIQVADQAWREGFHRALVLMEDNEWGKRNFDVFLDRWLNLGGDIADKQTFTSQKDYSTLVQALLNVDSSEKRGR